MMNVYYFHHQADELLGTASEQFLGKSVKEIKQTILQTLEGHLRAILGKQMKNFSLIIQRLRRMLIFVLVKSPVIMYSSVTVGIKYTGTIFSPNISGQTKKTLCMFTFNFFLSIISFIQGMNILFMITHTHAIKIDYYFIL